MGLCPTPLQPCRTLQTSPRLSKYGEVSSGTTIPQQQALLHSLGSLNASPSLADINLHELQKTLDQQGLEIVENQKENMVGRKKLAESTRGTQLPNGAPGRVSAMAAHNPLDDLAQSSRRLQMKRKVPRSNRYSRVRTDWARSGHAGLDTEPTPRLQLTRARLMLSQSGPRSQKARSLTCTNCWPRRPIRSRF